MCSSFCGVCWLQARILRCHPGLSEGGSKFQIRIQIWRRGLQNQGGQQFAPVRLTGRLIVSLENIFHHQILKESNGIGEATQFVLSEKSQKITGWAVMAAMVFFGRLFLKHLALCKETFANSAYVMYSAWKNRYLGTFLNILWKIVVFLHDPNRNISKQSSCFWIPPFQLFHISGKPWPPGWFRTLIYHTICIILTMWPLTLRYTSPNPQHS